ncbi:MAG: hypothetical protein AM326_05890 [Candidatus Thorarchaeota archaeon SMTZ-45]|nr:MAG: hypothetical protein AM326_05890 [Candidatus Thorarchaeota archaeon SMTZ-45]
MGPNIAFEITLGIIECILGCRTSMTSDCPDGLCKLKIQAIDRAIGHHKNEWSILLNSSKESKDVEHALRFCKMFHLESKVKIDGEDYIVLVKNELIRLL